MQVIGSFQSLKDPHVVEPQFIVRVKLSHQFQSDFAHSHLNTLHHHPWDRLLSVSFLICTSKKESHSQAGPAALRRGLKVKPPHHLRAISWETVKTLQHPLHQSVKLPRAMPRNRDGQTVKAPPMVSSQPTTSLLSGHQEQNVECLVFSLWKVSVSLGKYFGSAFYLPGTLFKHL